jgi:hypothetical protein
MSRRQTVAAVSSDSIISISTSIHTLPGRLRHNSVSPLAQPAHPGPGQRQFQDRDNVDYNHHLQLTMMHRLDQCQYQCQCRAVMIIR